jgi:hypothetical protein
MNHSDTIGALAQALCKAQLEFTPILKEAENPAFKRGNKVSKYADMHSLVKATQPALAKHGLAIIQSASVTNTELTLNTLLVHSSGEWHSHDFTLPAKDDRGFTAHSVGKAMTYARRYSWQSVTGAVSEEDDDGNDAAGQGTVEAAQAVAQQKIAEAKEKGHTPINKPPVPPPAPAKATPQEAEDFVTLDGTLLGIEQKVTTKEKGSKPFYKVFMAVNDGKRIADIETVAWENFALPEGTTLFKELDLMPSEAALSFVCKTSEYKGKQQYSIKSVNRIGSKVFGDSGQA